jgi:hypothetical protein
MMRAASTIDIAAVKAACRPFRYPCKFDSVQHEISFIATVRLLEFGSGYDHLLAEQDAKCAKDAVQVRRVMRHVADTYAKMVCRCRMRMHGCLCQDVCSGPSCYLGTSTSNFHLCSSGGVGTSFMTRFAQACAHQPTCTTQMGVMGMHMSDSKLDTAAFKEFNHQQLIALFELDSHVQTDSGIPGVSMSKPVRPSRVCPAAWLPSRSCLVCLHLEEPGQRTTCPLVRNKLPHAWLSQVGSQCAARVHASLVQSTTSGCPSVATTNTCAPLLVQGPLAGWTQQLVRTMNTTGEALEAEGLSSLGEFVIKCLKDCTAGGKPARAAHLVSELVWPASRQMRSRCRMA